MKVPEYFYDLGLLAFFEAMSLVLIFELISRPFDYTTLFGALICGGLAIVHSISVILRYQEFERHELLYHLVMTKYLMDQGYDIDQIVKKEIPGESIDEFAKSLTDIYDKIVEHEGRRPISL